MMSGSDLPLAVIMGNQGAPGQGEAPLDGFNLCLPCQPCNSFASINATDRMQAKALSALMSLLLKKNERKQKGGVFAYELSPTGRTRDAHVSPIQKPE